MKGQLQDFHKTELFIYLLLTFDLFINNKQKHALENKLHNTIC